MSRKRLILPPPQSFEHGVLDKTNTELVRNLMTSPSEVAGVLSRLPCHSSGRGGALCTKKKEAESLRGATGSIRSTGSLADLACRPMYMHFAPREAHLTKGHANCGDARNADGGGVAFVLMILSLIARPLQACPRGHRVFAILMILICSVAAASEAPNPFVEDC